MSTQAEPLGPMVFFTSWPLADTEGSRRRATELFDVLRKQAGIFDDADASEGRTAHDVALIEAPEGWIVAVGGLPDQPDTPEVMHDWFGYALGHLPEGGPQPLAVATTLEANLGEEDLAAFVTTKGWGRVVDSFTTRPAAHDYF